MAALLGVLSQRQALAQSKPLVADEWSRLSEDDQIERRDLKFRTLKSLVQIKDFKTTIIAPGFASTYRTYRGSASMVVSGKLVHPFSTTVRDPIIRIGFFSKQDLQKAWKRFTTSPLMLTEHELNQALPAPTFHWVQDASNEGVFEPGDGTAIRVETKFRDIKLQIRKLPELFVMLDEYSLDEPSPQDLIKIINQGGVGDLAAATRWAHGSVLERPDWPEPQRKKLALAIVHRLKTMRPPLQYADLQRFYTLMALIDIVAKPQDLEEILETSRNVNVLMTSVGLSYYDAVREELQFDLPIHKIRSLPSMQEYLQSFKHALQEVRRNAIPELVKLAFDPLDFREAPKGLFKVSSVQAQAQSLLEPLTSVNVNQLMGTGGGDPDTQKRLLTFFVQARHAPAIATLLHWLNENPDQVEDLGVRAAKSMGALIVPALLRAFLEPRDPQERRIARTMLLALPKEAQGSAVEALRGSGVMLSPDVDVTQAILAFEQHEDQVRERKADLLEQTIFGPRAKEHSLVRRMVMLQDLANTAPSRIEPRGTETLDLLAKVAKTTMHSAPAHSDRALKLFESLPFGAREQQARTRLILTRARMQELEGKLGKARAILVKEDPALENSHYALLYSQLSRKVIREGIDTASYLTASRTLHEAKAKLPHDDRFEVLERELFVARHKTAFILVGLALLLSLTGLSYLLARWIARRWQAHRERRAQAPQHGAGNTARQASLEETQFHSGPPQGPISSSEAGLEGTEEEVATPDQEESVPPSDNEAIEESAALPGQGEGVARSFEDDFDDELDAFDAIDESVDPESIDVGELIDSVDAPQEKPEVTGSTQEVAPPVDESEQGASVDTASQSAKIDADHASDDSMAQSEQIDADQDPGKPSEIPDSPTATELSDSEETPSSDTPDNQPEPKANEPSDSLKFTEAANQGPEAPVASAPEEHGSVEELSFTDGEEEEAALEDKDAA